MGKKRVSTHKQRTVSCTKWLAFLSSGQRCELGLPGCLLGSSLCLISQQWLTTLLPLPPSPPSLSSLALLTAQPSFSVSPPPAYPSMFLIHPPSMPPSLHPLVIPSLLTHSHHPLTCFHPYHPFFLSLLSCSPRRTSSGKACHAPPACPPLPACQPQAL